MRPAAGPTKSGFLVSDKRNRQVHGQLRLTVRNRGPNDSLTKVVAPVVDKGKKKKRFTIPLYQVHGYYDTQLSFAKDTL